MLHQRYTRPRADGYGIPSHGRPTQRNRRSIRPRPPECTSTGIVYRTSRLADGECPSWAVQRDINGCCVFFPEIGTLTTQTRDEQYLFMLRLIMERRQVDIDRSDFMDWVYNTLPEWRFSSFDTRGPPYKAPISMADERVGEINDFMAIVAPDNIEVHVEVPSNVNTPSRFVYLNNVHGHSIYTCPTEGAMIDVWDMGIDMYENWTRITDYDDLTPSLRSPIQDCTVVTENVAAVIPEAEYRETCFLSMLYSVHDMCVFGRRMRPQCYVEIKESRRTANIPNTHKRLVSDSKSEAEQVMERLETRIQTHGHARLVAPDHRTHENTTYVAILVSSRILHYACGSPVTFIVHIYPEVYIALNNRSQN